MDGYALLCNSYEKILSERKHSEEEAANIQKEIFILKKFIGTTESDINAMFNTGAFNDICKGFFRLAMKNCEIPEKDRERVMEEFRWLLDTLPAEEARKH